MLSVATLSNRPRLTVTRVLSSQHEALLTMGYGDPDALVDVGGVAIYDGVDQPDWSRGAILLGVGLRGADQIAQALHDLGVRGAAALVVRDPVPRCSTISAAAASSGVAVLVLAEGRSWLQVNSMLEALVSADENSETLSGIPTGDLFTLANAVAALLDAPITIEDRDGRVLAFSDRQDEADPSRAAAIVERRVSAENLRALESHGVFDRLYRTDEPVYVSPRGIQIDGLSVPRVAIAVRAGNEILGSLWAAGPVDLGPDRVQAFRDVARLVAPHMLSQRAGADIQRRLRAERLEAVLDGGRDAAHRLGLLDQPAIVLALAVPDSANGLDASRTAERQLLSDAFAMHLTAAHPRAIVALIGDTTYGILPVKATNGAAQQRATRLSANFLDRAGGKVRAFIGIGSVASGSAGLPGSRLSADRALRVLRLSNGHVRVANISEVYVEALLLELREQIDVRGDVVRGPVTRLAEYDRKHGTCLVRTLSAWLDCFGDVADAAAAVGVHANTFRYRLRRLAEVAGIDLGDANTRFAAMLVLRLMADDL
ncbi:PucR family transcriptional regulator [Actinocrispum wychmicini]|uniref:DNA-binding PucR family transcriptional regulator n=1 Tax=Actinocrispum wychmicini TaxID=1213861 RepID=A0A4R2JDB5_9PSEU|nr:helix-turn-helix domain-containing protein [Actinocrispum wychmicini]TCO54169.1 DNA-binding PucR family transcriptional regulator [Actinocrispum wychmicini]